MSSTRPHEVMWLGSKVECYNPALVEGDYEFYKSFTINNEVYNAGDFVVVNKTANVKLNRIARLLCVYESHQKWHSDAKCRGIVRWYAWARNLEKTCNLMGIKLDIQNEVLEDYCGTDVFISLGDVRKKCKIIFATIDDPIYLIGLKKLDKNTHFSCRYKIEYDTVTPIFSSSTNHSTPQSYMNDLNLEFSAVKNKESTKSVTVLTTKHKKRNICSGHHANTKTLINKSDTYLDNSSDKQSKNTNNFSVSNNNDKQKSIKITLSMPNQQANPEILNKSNKTDSNCRETESHPQKKTQIVQINFRTLNSVDTPKSTRLYKNRKKRKLLSTEQHSSKQYVPVEHINEIVNNQHSRILRSSKKKVVNIEISSTKINVNQQIEET